MIKESTISEDMLSFVSWGGEGAGGYVWRRRVGCGFGGM
jgi:hypothetical protein